MTGPIRPDPADTSAEALAESLRGAVGRFVRSVRSQSGTPRDAQADALADLAHAGPMSIAGLAESRGVTHQSMRLVVARLEAAGLLKRQPDPADGRGWLMSLTAAGRRTVDKDRQARAQWLAQAIDEKLSPRERETLSQAVPLLLRLIDGS